MSEQGIRIVNQQGLAHPAGTMGRVSVTCPAVGFTLLERPRALLKIAGLTSSKVKVSLTTKSMWVTCKQKVSERTDHWQLTAT